MAGLAGDRLAAELDAAADACTRQGSALTDLRRLVLALVLEAGRPVTAYQLLDQLKERRPRGAVPATVYRAVEFLIRAHLIHRIESLNAFVPCTDSAHAAHAAQFLICQDCGTVTELEDDNAMRALARAAAEAGFTAARAMVEIAGICAACRDVTSAGISTASPG